MKHGYRNGSVFPKPTGNSDQINRQGESILSQILNDPERKIVYTSNGKFEIYAADGRGACYKKDGSFRGFVER